MQTESRQGLELRMPLICVHLLRSLSLMANDTRVLFCLIEGDTNPFEVTVSTDKSISFLKKVIWEECKNGYARDLVLWKVSRSSRNYPVCS